MKAFQLISLAACAIASQFAGLGSARAQHFDVLTQQVNGKLVTGTADFDSNQWQLGLRVFHRGFDSDYAINNPGFNALGTGSVSMPAGAEALPGNTDLSWDFLPMTTNDLSQNLFYWNGQDTDGMPGLTPNDVVFGPLPGPNYTLSLFDKSNTKTSVGGTNAIVPGGVIDTTAADGAMHRHRFFFLEDGDGSGATVPADGLYLLAMRLRMTGLANSLPVFMVFGTPGSSVAAEDDAAFPWVQQQLNLPGDYNQNGEVDAADYAVWRQMDGQSGPSLAADGDGNQVVNQLDYDFWRQRFGDRTKLIVSTGAAVASAATLSLNVPEPPGVQFLLLAFLVASNARLVYRSATQVGFFDAVHCAGSSSRFPRFMGDLVT
jgi:hypothetical protein